MYVHRYSMSNTTPLRPIAKLVQFIVGSPVRYKQNGNFSLLSHCEVPGFVNIRNWVNNSPSGSVNLFMTISTLSFTAGVRWRGVPASQSRVKSASSHVLKPAREDNDSTYTAHYENLQLRCLLVLAVFRIQSFFSGPSKLSCKSCLEYTGNVLVKMDILIVKITYGSKTRLKIKVKNPKHIIIIITTTK